MKRRAFVFGCMSIVAAGALAAASSGAAAWVGVWNGKLDGQPGVRLTMGNDAGELGGTVVFNMIKRENGKARVAGSTTHVLMHPRLDGDTVTFQVVRPSDSRELQMTVTLKSDGKAQLRCVNCDPDATVTELVREQ